MRCRGTRGAGWRRDADVVVVGSGAAGITRGADGRRARGLRVLMVTKDLIGGATPLAQGGLAAAIGPGDSAAAHVERHAGRRRGAVRAGTWRRSPRGAPGAIDWLAGSGRPAGPRELRLEGGHSRHRIVHSGDDATGAEVHRALLAALLASGIEILDRTVALDLVRARAGARPRAARRAIGGGKLALRRGLVGCRHRPGRRAASRG